MGVQGEAAKVGTEDPGKESNSESLTERRVKSSVGKQGQLCVQDTGEPHTCCIWMNAVSLLWPDLPLRPLALKSDSGLPSVSISLDKRHKGHPRTCYPGWAISSLTHEGLWLPNQPHAGV